MSARPFGRRNGPGGNEQALETGRTGARADRDFARLQPRQARKVRREAGPRVRCGIR